MNNNLQITNTNLAYNSPLYIESAPKGVEQVIGKEAGKRFEWQDDAIRELFDETNKLYKLYNCVVVPCGGGKSSLQTAMAVLDIESTRYGRKQLFVVPQCHIADGFFKQNGEYKIIKVLGNVYTVKCLDTHNFCYDSSNPQDRDKGTIERLKKWITTDAKKLAKKFCKLNVHEVAPGLQGKEITGLVAITTNQALALAFMEMVNEYSPRKLRSIFHNIHLRLDESHHLAMGAEETKHLSIEDAREQKATNTLGEIVKHLYRKNDGTSALTLSTATNFRSDGRPVVWDSMYSEFSIYNRAYNEHFATLGVKLFQVGITQFDKNPISIFIKNLKRERSQFHYVAVPPKNCGFRKGFTEATDWGVDTLVAAIKKAWPGVRILNLVPDEERAGDSGTKRALLDEPKNPDPAKKGGAPEYDIVLTCMLGREGADWCPASRLHVLYSEGSLVLSVQTLGRLSRRFRAGTTAIPWLKSRYERDGKGKTTLIARYYYPTFEEPKRGKSIADIFDGRKNALLAMLMATEDMLPILFPTVPHKRTKKGKKEAESIAELIGQHKYMELKEEFVEEWLEGRARDMGLDEFNCLTEALLEKYNVPEEYTEQACTTLRTIALRCCNLQNFKGIKVDFISEAGFAKMYRRLKDHSFDFTKKQREHLKKILADKSKELMQATREETKRIAKLLGHQPSIYDFVKHTTRRELVLFANRIKRQSIRKGEQ